MERLCPGCGCDASLRECLYCPPPSTPPPPPHHPRTRDLLLALIYPPCYRWGINDGVRFICTPPPCMQSPPPLIIIIYRRVCTGGGRYGRVTRLKLEAVYDVY